MLQQTFTRLFGLSLGQSLLICNQDHRFLATDQIRDLVEADNVLEPCRRNTEPAVIVVASRLQQAGKDEPMLVLFVDHAIADESVFHKVLASAHSLAERGNIVTLGSRA